MTGLPDELPSALGASCCHVLLDGNYLEGKCLENFSIFSQNSKLINWALKVPLWSESSLYTSCTAGEFITVIIVNGHIYRFIQNWYSGLYEIPYQTAKIFQYCIHITGFMKKNTSGIHIKSLGFNQNLESWNWTCTVVGRSIKRLSWVVQCLVLELEVYYQLHPRKMFIKPSICAKRKLCSSKGVQKCTTGSVSWFEANIVSHLDFAK